MYKDKAGTSACVLYYGSNYLEAFPFKALFLKQEKVSGLVTE